MPFADLHTHSTASDGTSAPEQLAQAALDCPGIGAVALTDHDTLSGLDAASRSCAMHGIAFVPGVEITTRHDGRAVHMLGYFVRHDDSSLLGYMEENRLRRASRAYEMADRLGDGGYPVCADDLRATGQTPNRPLLARLLMERGCVASVDEAFARLLGSGSPFYVDAVYPDTIEAMRLIREAGGSPFIAHPARYGVVDLIPCLAREGMAGLEAYHTLQSAEQSAELLALAGELGLGVSGGSDWHGAGSRRSRLGTSGLDEEEYRAFLDSCGRA